MSELSTQGADSLTVTLEGSVFIGLQKGFLDLAFIASGEVDVGQEEVIATDVVGIPGIFALLVNSAADVDGLLARLGSGRVALLGESRF